MEKKKIKILNFPEIVDPKLDSESKFWNSFKFPIQTKLLAPVTHISFSPIAPHDFIVSSSSRLEIYSGNTSSGEPEKSISKFKETAYCGKFRNDGKLIISGSADGIVRVFTRWGQQMRTLKGHSGEVWFVQFSQNQTDIMSAGDDGLIKRFDLMEGKEVQTMKGHTDKIRNGIINKENSNIWISGGYDGKIKGWDLREEKSVFEINNFSEITALNSFPQNSNLIAVGSNNSQINIFDLSLLSSSLSNNNSSTSNFNSRFSDEKNLTDKKKKKEKSLLESLNNHQKAVTCLSFDGRGKRMLSGSVDQLVKIYDVSDFSVKETIKYESPILSVGVSPDFSHFVCGMSDGLLSMKHKFVSSNNLSFDKKSSNLNLNSNSNSSKASSKRYFKNNFSSEKSENLDFDSQNLEISSTKNLELPYTSLKKKKKKTFQFEKHLAKFDYRMATDCAMKTKNALIISSFFNEIILRNEIENCISGFDEKTIQPLLLYLIENICNPHYSNICVIISNVLLSLYGKLIGISTNFDNLIFQLSKKIKEEIEIQKNLKRLQGIIETFN